MIFMCMTAVRIFPTNVTVFVFLLLPYIKRDYNEIFVYSLCLFSMCKCECKYTKGSMHHTVPALILRLSIAQLLASVPVFNARAIAI